MFQSMKGGYQQVVKIMLVGDSGVGKTAIMQRFSEDFYSDTTATTVGIQYKGKVIKVNNKKYLIQLWDTAGQQRFRSITPNFYRSAMAVLLVYSVEDRDTFSSVGAWLKQIKRYAPENLPVVLVANKCDLVRRQVWQKQGKAVADQYQIQFVECSAKQDINISDAIQKLVKSVKVTFQEEQKILALEGRKPTLRICGC